LALLNEQEGDGKKSPPQPFLALSESWKGTFRGESHRGENRSIVGEIREEEDNKLSAGESPFMLVSSSSFGHVTFAPVLAFNVNG